MKQAKEKCKLSSSLVYWSVLILCVVPYPGTLQAQGQSLPVAQPVLEEAQKGWERYSRKIDDLQGSYSLAFAALGFAQGINHQLKESSLTVVSYKKRTNARLLKYSDNEVNTKGKNSYVEVAFCLNPRYAFQIQRKSSSSPWVVVQLLDLDKDPIPELFERRFAAFASTIKHPVTLYDQPLLEVVRKPFFQVLECRRIQRNREELIELVFSYKHPEPDRDGTFQGGTLVLDPQRCWTLRSYQLEGKTSIGQGPMRYEVDEPGELGASAPAPKRAHQVNEWTFTKIIDNLSKNKQEWHWEFNLSEPSTLPSEQEFTLSAFGLPEPPGLAWRKPIPWYLWAAVAGIACLLLGVVFSWLRKRRLEPSTAR